MPSADATPAETPDVARGARAGKGGRALELPAGAVLFREGEASELLYVVQSGALRLSKSVDGGEITVAELGAGDFAGEVGAIGAAPHGVTATAISDTCCLAIDPATLLEMVDADPEIRVRLLRAMAQRIGESQRLLGLYAQRKPHARIALAIARMADAAEREADGAFVPKRMRDIGAEVGVSEEELGEVSKVLMRAKLIRIRRNGILVPDVQRMYDFVQSGETA